MKKILFSGRFDPPHCGHVATIKWLSENWEVLVVVLKSTDRKYPMAYCVDVLRTTLPREVSVEQYPVHFGLINKDDLLRFGCDVYASGNLSVLRHIEGLGVMDTLYVPRAFDYSSTEIRNAGTKLSVPRYSFDNSHIGDAQWT